MHLFRIIITKIEVRKAIIYTGRCTFLVDIVNNKVIPAAALEVYNLLLKTYQSLVCNT